MATYVHYPTKVSPESKRAAHLKVVIVGAGPAGLLAGILLCKRGYIVEVYDKLPSPRTVSVEEKRRTIVFGITARGQHALKEVGVALPERGWLHGMAIGRTTVIHNFPRRTMNTPSKNVMFAERTALIDHLTSEARRLAPRDKLTFFYEHALSDIDFEERRCSFTQTGGDGGTTTATYDLLIAADGIHSGVRSQLQRIDPDLKVDVIGSGRTYKAFHGLSPSDKDGWKMSGVDGADLHSMFGKDLSWSLALWPTRENMVAGVVNGDAAKVEQLRTPGDFGELLLTQFPSLPQKWALPASQQLAAGQARPFGASVRCSRLHGPLGGGGGCASVALLGDAAHGVTPFLGQGCNAALESATILVECLDVAGGNIPRALQHFTATRLSDAHALHTLDLQAQARIGLCGSFHPRFLGTAMHVLFWMAVSGLTLGWVRQPYLDAVMGRGSYAKALWAIQRDDIIGVTVLLTAMTWTCYWAAQKAVQLAPHLDLSFLRQEGVASGICMVVAGVAVLVRVIQSLSGGSRP